MEIRDWIDFFFFLSTICGLFKPKTLGSGFSDLVKLLFVPASFTETEFVNFQHIPEPGIELPRNSIF